MSYKVQIYKKYYQEINDYLRLRCDYENFKREHKKYRSVYSFQTKFKTLENIKLLEQKLSKKNISIQKIQKSFVKLKKNNKNLDDIEMQIINSFKENILKTKKYFFYYTQLDSKYCEMIVTNRNARSRASRESKQKFKKGQALAPYILNFIKEDVLNKNKTLSEHQANIIAERITHLEVFEQYLVKFKEKYGNLEEALNYFENNRAS